MKLSNASLLLLSSLSSAAFADGGVTKINGNITVASDVPAAESKILASDLAYLRTMKPQAIDAQLQQLLGTQSGLTEAYMELWLTNRVQYIISDKTNLESSIVLVTPNYAFPNPGLLPTQITNELPQKPATTADTAAADPQKPAADPAQGSGGVTVMLNIGGGLYMMGKATGNLVGITIPGAGVVPLTSPRVGVLQIGEGMFQPLMKDVGVPDVNSRAYTLFHLGTLFHEARHSDGNGKSLGFAHSLCPIDHDLAGLAGCDNSTNGAYTVDAAVIRNLTASCKDCTPADKEALKLEVIDSFSRVLKQSPSNEKLGILQSICQMAQQHPEMIPAEQKDTITKQCPAVIAMPNPIIPAVALDAHPEGKR
jgi:hypothetical protein